MPLRIRQKVQEVLHPMNTLMIDFETRSTLPLLDHGLYRYAADPTTDVFCCAVKRNDEATRIWVGPRFKKLVQQRLGEVLISDDEFRRMILDAKEIHAFNAQFERVIYRVILEKRYGFPRLPFEIWRCTAAKAAYYALPRSLEQVCKALGTTETKNTLGRAVMMKMTMPDKRTGKWHEKPDDFLTLLKYCVQDVEAEYDIDQRLREIPEAEIRMYHLDQKINDRGIYVDTEAVQNLIWKVEEKSRRLLLKVQELTGGKVKSTRQVEATKAWLKDQGLDLDNLQKETVKQALTENVPYAVQEMLSVRQSLAKSSVAKLNTMLKWACADNRVRGSLHFYGATTGRWAGRGIQPQNYPRDSFNEQEIEEVLNLGVADVDQKHGCTMLAASKSLRGMLGAAPGKTILCADFASIEARVLAWLAGEDKKVEAFAAGKDIYVLNASDIYRVPASQITKEQRLIGKVCELALGYQGWLGAFQSMAQVYGAKINIDRELDYARKKLQRSLTNDEEKEIREAKESEIIQAWRASNNRIVEFWNGVQSAALQAVKTEEAYSYGRIKFGMRGRFLHCRLPSGRLLSYCDPSTETIKTKYGVEKEVVTFMGWGANRWCRQYTYGGKLTENIVQATARDLLRDAMFRLDDKGFNLVMHVHDEVLSEENPEADLDQFTKIMAQVPDWAAGCPINAEGWKGKRYRK